MGDPAMKPQRILVRPTSQTRPGDSPIRVPGEPVQGTVSGIDGEDVQLEVTGGGKAVIPTTDFTSLPTVGDAIEGLYLIDDPAAGVAILTKKTPATEVDVSKVRPGMFVVGAVVEAGKPGLRIRCGEVAGFFPASQLPAGVLREPGKLLRKNVAGVVTDVRKGEMTLSLRTVLDRRQKQKTERHISSFREGQRLSGTVARVTDFGCFVDLGGIDGLLHISRIERHNEQRQENGDPPIAFEAKQPIDVIVSRVEPDRGRIGLDLADPDDPTAGYTPADEAQSEADEVTGILRDLSALGGNVYVEEGVEGWIATSRLAGHSPRPGELRRFRILSRDAVTGRLELTLRMRGGDDDDDDDF